MIELVKGIHQFPPSYFWPPALPYPFLSRGPRPSVLVVTCSDLGADPYSLVPASPAGLNVLQHLGNVVIPYEAAVQGKLWSMTAPFEDQSITDIVVCGHLGCDVIRRLLSPGSEQSPPSALALLKHLLPVLGVLAGYYGHLRGGDRFEAAVLENVLVQLGHVGTIPDVVSRLRSGECRLHGWVYDHENRRVCTYDPGKGQFSYCPVTSN